jgi:hypothetical protein
MVVGCGDARALLASMLEREQAVEGYAGDILTRSVDPEDAACFS